VVEKQAKLQAVANAQRHQPKAVKVVVARLLMLQEVAKVEVEEISPQLAVHGQQSYSKVNNLPKHKKAVKILKS
jgi:hypothetical protein